MQAEAETVPAHQRAAVKPRRKVPPEQRRRVVTACNSCNTRRIKCSGDHPCSRCASSHRECVYPALVERVSLPKAELDCLRQKVQLYEKIIQGTSNDSRGLQRIPNDTSGSSEMKVNVSTPSFDQPNTIRGESIVDDLQPSIASDSTASPDSSGRIATPGRIFRYPDGVGRYLGESSGAAFLDRVKDLVGGLDLSEREQLQNASEGTFLSNLDTFVTCDARPIYDPSVNPLWLPPDSVIQAALTKLEYFVQGGGRKWPSGGLYWWGDLQTLPVRPSLSKLPLGTVEEFRYLAYYHAALALANCDETNQTSTSTDVGISSSESYFARAAILLGNPLDIECRTICDVSTLGMMALYLLQTERTDSAYMYVTVALHTCIMLGTHRGLVDESGKRVFWSIYTLDRWLSCISGRPHTISDEDIRLSLPVDAPSMPPAAGLRAYVELSRISVHVVNLTYRQKDDEARSSELDKVVNMLENWQRTLPVLLQMTANGLTDDPACCMLHMRCNQLMIVATRALFYNAIKVAVANPGVLHASSQPEHFKRCITAAKSNILIASHYMDLVSDQRPHVPVGGAMFNGATCLILADLVFQHDITEEERFSRLHKVESVMANFRDFDDMSNYGGTSLGEILQDLRGLSAKLTSRGTSHPDLGLGQPNVSSSEEFATIQFIPSQPMDVGESPFLYDELVTWMGDNWPIYGGQLGD